MYKLSDIKTLAKIYSGNNNPGIFLLSDRKQCDKSDEAFEPSNIFIDDDGDIIIQFNEEMINN